MRHYQFIRVQAVVAEEQPAAKLLVDRMKAVANGGLRDLRYQCLCVAKQQIMKFAAKRKFRHK